MRPLLALLVLLPCAAFAGAWGLDAGLVGGVGMARFNAAPSGSPPPADPTNLFSLYPPSVAASGGAGLAGEAGIELTLHRKRRFSASLQVLWRGESLGMDETLTFPSGTTLNRTTLWEWSGVAFPLELSYSHPLSAGQGWALLGRAGAGAWYQKNEAWSKHLSSGASNLAQKWDGPPDDWGPLVGLGLDWLALPSGKRVCSFEVRATQGRAQVDPAAGGDQGVWTLGGVLSVPVHLWVL